MSRIRRPEPAALLTSFAGRADRAFIDGAMREVEVTPELVERHLLGEILLGIYPIGEAGLTRWSCADFDGTDEDEPLRFYGRAERLGWSPFFEISKSERSYHVWLFWEGGVPARAAWGAIRLLDKLAGTNCRELNPKAYDWWTGKLVNCVHLPWWGAAEGGRSVIVDPYTGALLMPPYDETPASEAHSATERLDVILARERQARAAWAPRAPVRGREGGSTQPFAEILRGNRRVGVGERDNQLHAVAMCMARGGTPEAEAMAKMEHIWRHQLDDPHTYSLEEALKKVRNAYR